MPDAATCISTLIADSAALGKPLTPPLVAADCDLLERSGLVDPLPALNSHARKTLGSAEQLFGQVAAELGAIPRIRKADLVEYCKLVVRQLY